MTPTIVAATGAIDTSTGPAVTLTIDTPAGLQDDDVLFAHFIARDSHIHPAGWTAFQDNVNAFRFHSLYYRVVADALNEPASHTFEKVNGSNGRMAGGIVAVRGVNILAPVDVSDFVTDNTLTTIDCPSVTTTGPNRRILRIAGWGIGTPDAWPAPVTELWTQSAGASAGRSSSGAGHNEQVTEGATGAVTLETNGSSSETKAGFTVAVQPAIVLESWSAVSGATSGAGGSMLCAAPTGIAVGDLLLYHLSQRSVASIIVPAGWTTIIDVTKETLGSAHGVRVAWRIATQDDVDAVTYEFRAHDGNTHRQGVVILRLTGHDPIAPIGSSDVVNALVTPDVIVDSGQVGWHMIQSVVSGGGSEIDVSPDTASYSVPSGFNGSTGTGVPTLVGVLREVAGSSTGTVTGVGGESPSYAAAATVVIQTSSTSLPSPENLHVLSTTETGVELGWDSVEGAAKYQVERDGIVVATIEV